ncbi:hypothetical protein NE237_008237 [Protea cynaroides]|uniref:Uncharacterized protein n=1 Tax=Protea cynaroides TaxID=273540 RepID=A0A9Q0KQL6_9MAGN|nr:hypothetical protein NE237_008237 [Protea cynaroides]
MVWKTETIPAPLQRSKSTADQLQKFAGILFQVVKSCWSCRLACCLGCWLPAGHGLACILRVGRLPIGCPLAPKHKFDAEMKGSPISGRALEKARVLFSVDHGMQTSTCLVPTTIPAGSHADEVRWSPALNPNHQHLHGLTSSQVLRDGHLSSGIYAPELPRKNEGVFGSPNTGNAALDLNVNQLESPITTPGNIPLHAEGSFSLLWQN